MPSDENNSPKQSKSYNAKKIREFLIEAFDDEELNSFCFDHYSNVHNRFSVGMTKTKKAQMLVEYCKRYGLLQEFVELIAQERPNQFDPVMYEVETESPKISLQVSLDTTTVQVGDSISIIADVTPVFSGELNWTIVGNAEGTLSNTTGSSSVYTAVSPGTDNVTVSGTTESGMPIEKTISIKVEGKSVTLDYLGENGDQPAQDGGTYPCLNLAKGTYNEDLEGQIWVVVLAGNYHVQDYQGKPPIMHNGTWSSDVRFGNCSDPEQGKIFKVLVVVADNQASQVFKAYLENGRQTGEYPGIDELPEGAEEHIFLSITRE